MVSKTISEKTMHSSLEPVHIVLHANLTAGELDLSQGLAQRFEEKSMNSFAVLPIVQVKLPSKSHRT